MEEIGMKGQLKLKQAKVLIIGAGGLGSPSALYLAAAGVGSIGLVDYDTVDLSNLQRQVIHSEDRVGKSKVSSARRGIENINSTCHVKEFQTALNRYNALDIVSQFDLVLDASDNAATRYLISDSCVLLNKPLVSGSALRMEGQLTIYHYQGGPCYRCIFPNPPPATTVTNCSDGGVLGAVPGVIGVLQALEAIKIIIGIPASFSQQLLLFDAMTGKFRNIKLRARQKECSSCGDNPSITKELINYEEFCGAPACDQTLSLKVLGDESRISCQQLKDKLSNPKDFLLIDVRPSLQFDICSLPFSKNIVYSPPNTSNAEFIQNIKDYLSEHDAEKKKDIVFICRRGNDSQLAVKLLQSELELPNLVDVTGGLTLWSKKIDTTFPRY